MHLTATSPFVEIAQLIEHRWKRFAPYVSTHPCRRVHRALSSTGGSEAGSDPESCVMFKYSHSDGNHVRAITRRQPGKVITVACGMGNER